MRLRAAAPVLLFAIATHVVGAARAQTISPPPLPPGQEQVRIDAGMAEEERKRHVRAHHHKLHHKKDFAHDGPESKPPPARVTKPTPPKQQRSSSIR